MSSTPTPAPRVPRVVLLAAVVAVLALAAAVIAFLDGSWLGIPFVLLAAVDGNLAWFYMYRARRDAGSVSPSTSPSAENAA